jgi:hypothetical protein
MPAYYIKPPQETPGNLLSNGSFEVGSIAPWASYVYGTNEARMSLTRSVSMHGTTSAALDRVNGVDPFVRTYVPITVGKTYTFSAYIYIPTSSGSTVSGGTNTPMAIADGPTFILAPGFQTFPRDQWVRVVLPSLTFSSGAISAELRLYCALAGGPIYIDGARLEEGTTAKATWIGNSTSRLRLGSVDNDPTFGSLLETEIYRGYPYFTENSTEIQILETQFKDWVEKRDPAVQGTNYVINPSFENGVYSWQLGGSAGACTLTPDLTWSVSGGYSARVSGTINSGTYQNAGLSTIASFPSGLSRLFFSSYIYTRQSLLTNRTNLAATWRAGDGTDISTTYINGPVMSTIGRVERMAATLIPPANAVGVALNIYTDIGSSSTLPSQTVDFNVDCVLLSDADIPYFDGSFSIGQNLLRPIQEWGGQGTVSTDFAYSGTTSFKFIATANNVPLMPTLPITSSLGQGTYTLQAMVRAPLGMKYEIDGSDTASTVYVQQYYTGTGTWQPVSATWTTGVATSGPNFKVRPLQTLEGPIVAYPYPIYLDAPILVRGTAVGDASPTWPDTRMTAWTGAPHQSPSVKYI